MLVVILLVYLPPSKEKAAPQAVIPSVKPKAEQASKPPPSNASPFVTKLIADKPASAWTPLFNGEDLTGWQSSDGQPLDASVQDGALVLERAADAKTARLLFSQHADYQDFHLRFEFRPEPGCDSGLFVRLPPGTSAVQGNVFKIHLRDTEGGFLVINNSGILRRVGTGATFKHKEWTPIEVLVQGKRIVVAVRGEVTADHTVEGVPLLPPTGHIAFQAGKGRAELRDIEIRELGSTLLADPAFAKAQAQVLQLLEEGDQNDSKSVLAQAAVLAKALTSLDEVISRHVPQNLSDARQMVWSFDVHKRALGGCGPRSGAFLKRLPAGAPGPTPGAIREDDRDGLRTDRICQELAILEGRGFLHLLRYGLPHRSRRPASRGVNPADNARSRAVPQASQACP